MCRRREPRTRRLRRHSWHLQESQSVRLEFGVSWALTVRRDVRKAASLLAVVEAVGSVWWRVVLKPGLDRGLLVAWEREDVAEASPRVDDRLARLFWLCSTGEDVGSWDDLRGTHGGNIGAVISQQYSSDPTGDIALTKFLETMD